MVRSGATMTGANLWVLVMAIFTASLGLNVNSTPVIIGAMLISPLMGPIMAIGMGVAIHDFALVYRAFKNFCLAVLLSILTSAIYFLISPLKVPGSELLARTTPTIYDVLIAIFGGLAGIIAGSGKLRQSNVVPGVAIATALMPPLCTVGFGLANLNPTYVFGAFYLFFINTVFISLATYFIVRILKYPSVENLHSGNVGRIRRFISFVVIFTLLPSIYLTWQIVRRYILEEKVKQYVQNEFSGPQRLILKSAAEYRENRPIVTVTLIGSEIDSAEYQRLCNRMHFYGLGKATLEVQQGFGDNNKGAALLGSMTSSIGQNRDAIGRIFADMAGLENVGKNLVVRDSLEISIGRYLSRRVPGLSAFSIEPVQFYDAATDRKKTGWKAQIRVKKSTSVIRLDSISLWLKQQLPGDTVIVIEGK